MSANLSRGLLFVVLLATAGAQERRPDVAALLEGMVGGDRAVLAVRDLERFWTDERKPLYDASFMPPGISALHDPLGLMSSGLVRGQTLSRARALSDTTRLAELPELADPAVPKELAALDPAVARAVTRLYFRLGAATEEIRAAHARLSDDDKAFLRTQLPRFLGRTQPGDRERALKGVEDVDQRKAMMRCAELVKKIDKNSLRRAWSLVVRGVEEAMPHLGGQKELSGNRIPVEGPLGPILLGGTGDGGGEDDALLVIDFGGNDEHRMPEQPVWRPVRVVIDVDGDDLYLGKAAHSWGGALLGVSLTVDMDGHDDYRAGDWGLGCGLGGLGALWDLHGNDRYYGGLGVCGAAIFGEGILLDSAGDDEYVGGLFCQGFASTGGSGKLIDQQGDDTYTAGRDDEDIWRRAGTYITFAQGAAYGHRFGHIWKDDEGHRRWKMTGQLPGGDGLLVDGGGNDRYEADVFGQGAGYWYSVGTLVDLGGNDRYRATWYGQGVGTHLAAGCLIDGGGDDFYFSRNTSQGCGHDFSVGILRDLGGNDEYRGVALCQGAGNAFNALGLLVDEGGDDRYACGRRSWGFGSTEKRKPEWAPYGLFLDLFGDDRYEGRTPPRKGEAGRWRQQERGFGWDR